MCAQPNVWRCVSVYALNKWGSCSAWKECYIFLPFWQMAPGSVFMTLALLLCNHRKTLHLIHIDSFYTSTLFLLVLTAFPLLIPCSFSVSYCSVASSHLSQFPLYLMSVIDDMLILWVFLCCYIPALLPAPVLAELLALKVTHTVLSVWLVGCCVLVQEGICALHKMTVLLHGCEKWNSLCVISGFLICTFQ